MMRSWIEWNAKLLTFTPSRKNRLTKVLGRSKGPTFVHRSALDDEIAGSRKTTSVSRAWRRTANWLDDLQKSKWIAKSKLAAKKNSNYSHPAPDKCNATPQQMASFNAFEVWRGIIIESMLEHEHWVRILKDTAIQNAEREERAAQHASLSKWIKWVNEGPACGLRR